MSRIGMTLVVTGLGRNVCPRDLAVTFERYGPLDTCLVSPEDSGSRIAIVKFTKHRDAGDALYELQRNPFTVDANPTGLTLCLPQKKYHIFHERLSPETGNELWYFLRSLSNAEWATLEARLQSDIKWIDEGSYTNKKEWKHIRNFPKYGNRSHPDDMKTLLERSRSHPGYALNMVAQGKLHHIIHHEPDISNRTEATQSREQKPWIFGHLEFEYRVDFSTRSMQTFSKGEWISLPFVSDEALQHFNDISLVGQRKDTLSYINSGLSHAQRRMKEERGKSKHRKGGS